MNNLQTKNNLEELIGHYFTDKVSFIYKITNSKVADIILNKNKEGIESGYIDILYNIFKPLTDKELTTLLILNRRARLKAIALGEDFISNNKYYTEIEESINTIKFHKIDKSFFSKVLPEIIELDNYKNSTYILIESDKNYFHIARLDNESSQQLYIIIYNFELNKTPKKRKVEMNSSNNQMSDLDLNQKYSENVSHDNTLLINQTADKLSKLNKKLDKKIQNVPGSIGKTVSKVSIASNPFNDNYLKENLDNLDIEEYNEDTHQKLLKKESNIVVKQLSNKDNKDNKESYKVNDSGETDKELSKHRAQSLDPGKNIFFEAKNNLQSPKSNYY